MAVFACDRCGKCCVSLGTHITIERQLNDRDYYCRSAIDNAIVPVAVDPAYRNVIADEFEREDPDRRMKEKMPCIFLRKNPEGNGTACAIYASRPKVCRDFRCYRMIIRNREGAVCGRVIGKNSLRTDDEMLKKLWDDRVAAIPLGEPVAWAKTIAGILAEHGYCVDPVE